jgi:C4-dicarboxylate-specific signal transduction histidine kinase
MILHFTTLFIDSYREGVILTVCLLILLYLLYNRIRFRQYVLDKRLTARQGPGFSAQVMARLVSQQTERSLAAVVRTIVDERERLQQWVEKSVLQSDDENHCEPAGCTAALEASSGGDNREAAREASAQNRYAGIPQLAAAGKTAAEIAVAIERPLAEIELCLALARRRAARAVEEKPEKFAPPGKNFRLVPMRRVV